MAETTRTWKSAATRSRSASVSRVAIVFASSDNSTVARTPNGPASRDRSAMRSSAGGASRAPPAMEDGAVIG